MPSPFPGPADITCYFCPDSGQSSSSQPLPPSLTCIPVPVSCPYPLICPRPALTSSYCSQGGFSRQKSDLPTPPLKPFNNFSLLLQMRQNPNMTTRPWRPGPANSSSFISLCPLLFSLPGMLASSLSLPYSCPPWGPTHPSVLLLLKYLLPL